MLARACPSRRRAACGRSSCSSAVLHGRRFHSSSAPSCLRGGGVGDADGLVDDFGADAVAADDRDAVVRHEPGYSGKRVPVVRAAGGGRVVRILAIGTVVRRGRPMNLRRGPAGPARRGEFRRHGGRVKMGNRLRHLRRAGLDGRRRHSSWASGCAFPNGATGGDPILGNFNRPIVPTPPPERGGLGLDSPAYDAGARIGLASPDVPTPVENSGGGIEPAAALQPEPVLRGPRVPFGGAADEPFLGPEAGRERGPATVAQRRPRAPACRSSVGPTRTASPSARGSRATASPAGSAFTPPESSSPVRPVGYETLKDPAKVKSWRRADPAPGGRGPRAEDGATLRRRLDVRLHGRGEILRGPRQGAARSHEAVLNQMQKDR